MTVTKSMIEERISGLESDIKDVSEKIQVLERQKTENFSLLNALQGAKQQCQSFLNELNNDEPDASDSGDVDK